MPNWSKSVIQAVWEKSRCISHKDGNFYRKDALGNVIHRSLYGRDTPMGWEIDHITPKSRGGSDHIDNLESIHTAANRKKRIKFPWSS